MSTRKEERPPLYSLFRPPSKTEQKHKEDKDSSKESSVKEIPIERKLNFDKDDQTIKRANSKAFEPKKQRRHVSILPGNSQRCNSSYLKKHTDNCTNIKVVARVRPLNRMEEVFNML